MPTTGAIKANNLLMYVDDNAVLCTKSASISSSLAFIDATCKDNDGAEQSLPAGLSWSGALDGIYAMDATYGADDLWALHLAKTRIAIKFSTEVTGDTFFSGNAYIESINMNGNVNDVAQWDISLKGDGIITKGTVA